MIIIHLFIACVNQNIVLSSLPPSQSSVDHKEFKRCGPFDPYINAKVCTTCCQNNISLWSASLLSCCVCLLCLIWSVAAARGATSACSDMGKLLISPAIRLITVLWLSTHVNIVISNCVRCVIKMTALQHSLHFSALLLLIVMNKLQFRMKCCRIFSKFVTLQWKL